MYEFDIIASFRNRMKRIDSLSAETVGNFMDLMRRGELKQLVFLHIQREGETPPILRDLAAKADLLPDPRFAQYIRTLLSNADNFRRSEPIYQQINRNLPNLDELL